MNFDQKPDQEFDLETLEKIRKGETNYITERLKKVKERKDKETLDKKKMLTEKI
ncbi:MAG: hypothetical protein WAN61_01750 [Minisyncoccia bacterium]